MQEELKKFLNNPDFLSSASNSDQKGKNLTERVLYILQSYHSFRPMSNNAFFETQNFSNWGSFEDFHNAIHSYVGGRGHMGNPGIASFDPIFWLHHA